MSSLPVIIQPDKTIRLPQFQLRHASHLPLGQRTRHKIIAVRICHSPGTLRIQIPLIGPKEYPFGNSCRFYRCRTWPRRQSLIHLLIPIIFQGHVIHHKSTPRRLVHPNRTPRAKSTLMKTEYQFYRPPALARPDNNFGTVLLPPYRAPPVQILITGCKIPRPFLAEAYMGQTHIRRCRNPHAVLLTPIDLYIAIQLMRLTNPLQPSSGNKFLTAQFRKRTVAASRSPCHERDTVNIGLRRAKRKRSECAKRNKPYRLQESPHQIIPLENRLHQFDEIPDG